MARNDYVENAGPDAPSADGLADDLKHLLDQLAAQLSDADQRHSETVHGMQERVTALTERAAAAKADIPEHCDEAFGRVENAMATFADRLATVEPGQRQRDTEQADDAASILPNEVRDEIRRAISFAQQGPADAPPVLRSAVTAQAAAKPATTEPATPARPFGELDDAFIAPAAAASPRAFRAPSEAPRDATASAARSSTEIDPVWLEARFAEIAGRVEDSLGKLDPHNSLLTLGERFGQLERRFDVALQHLGTPAGGGITALQTLEKQITDMCAELGRAQQQLGRLEAIESRLTELRQSPTEQQMAQLVGAMKPNDQQLSAIVEVAAERVAERLRQAAPQMSSQATADGAAAPVAGDSGLGTLTAMIQEFIGEQRQGDVQTADALDTMQLAMQHLIDRVEAIEAAQSNGHEELLRAAQGAPARRPERPIEPFERNVRETNLTPATVSSVVDELPRLTVSNTPSPSIADHDLPEPQLQAPIESRYDHDRPASPRAPITEPHFADPLDPLDEPQPTARTGGGTNRDAFIAMARRAADKAAREAPAAPIAAASTGAFGWLKRLTGKSASNEDATAARRPRLLLVASFVAFLLAGFWMLTGTGLRGYITGSITSLQMLPIKSSARDEGAARTATSTPAAPTAAESVGIVIDNGRRTVDPARMIEAREQVQMASLSAKLGQDRPPPSTLTTTLPAPTGSPLSAMSRAVEMPPALIGPLSLRHAAANGDAAAQLEIAARFAEGKGVPQDFAQAATWYQRAATHGLATAQYRLGQLYERGLGVSADPSRARIWYGRAAEQGNVQAMHNLAALSASGTSGSPDYPTAIQWFSESANRGLADSQYNLGVLYERGLGVPESLAEAYKWYSLAARSSDKDAIRRRDALRNRLDTVSRDAVDKLIIEWRVRPTEAAANEPRNAGQIWRVQPSTQVSQQPAR